MKNWTSANKIKGDNRGAVLTLTSSLLLGYRFTARRDGEALFLHGSTLCRHLHHRFHHHIICWGNTKQHYSPSAASWSETDMKTFKLCTTINLASHSHKKRNTYKGWISTSWIWRRQEGQNKKPILPPPIAHPGGRWHVPHQATRYNLSRGIPRTVRRHSGGILVRSPNHTDWLPQCPAM